MGYLASSSTIYARAYLTDTGRAYLFNQNNTRFDTSGDDLFLVRKFAISDADTNYQTTLLLETGEVPDVTGKSEGCLKTAADYVQRNLIPYVFENIPTNVDYNTDLPQDASNTDFLLIDASSLSTTTETPPPYLLVAVGNTSGSFRQ